METSNDIGGRFWSIVTIMTKQAREDIDKYRQRIKELICEIDDSDSRRMRFEELLAEANKKISDAYGLTQDLQKEIVGLRATILDSQNDVGIINNEINPHEKQSGLDCVKYAELLILQLPYNNNGRTEWLLNYGKLNEANRIRKEHKG